MTSAIGRVKAVILVVLVLLGAASGLAYLSFSRTSTAPQNETTSSTLPSPSSSSFTSPSSTSSSLSSSPSSLSSSSSPSSTQSQVTSSGKIENASWVTYHGNNARTGVDQTLQSFSSVKLAWKSTHLDGAIYAEPLIAGDRIIAATENNSVYAIGADNGSVIWRTNFGRPVPRSDLPCGDIDPTGITGTPAIDLASGALYVVAFLGTTRHHELFALNLDDGSIRFHRPADPASSDPLVQQQRAALTLANGFVYIPYGGLYGDCGAYHGWLLGIRVDGTGDPVDYQVPTGRAGGIWAPSGAAVDGSGDLYVATGNSFSNDKFDFGDSVIKLSPSLKLIDWFAPSDWSTLNSEDMDLGSVGPTFVDSTTIFQIGKDGIGYLLDSQKLGQIGGQQFSAGVCGGAFGGTAYAEPLLLVPCVDGIVALSVSHGSSPSFNVVWHGPNFNAGPPVVVGGAVWTVDIGEGILYALSLTDGHVIFKAAIGGVVHFTTPGTGGGRVYVAGDEQILAFALNPQ